MGVRQINNTYGRKNTIQPDNNSKQGQNKYLQMAPCGSAQTRMRKLGAAMRHWAKYSSPHIGHSGKRPTYRLPTPGRCLEDVNDHGPLNPLSWADQLIYFLNPWLGNIRLYYVTNKVQEIWANAHETHHRISLISYLGSLGLSLFSSIFQRKFTLSVRRSLE